MNFISKLFGLLKKGNLENDFDIDINDFDSINSFWEFITTQEKWYIKYSSNRIKNVDNFITELEPLIINTTNELRKKMEFTYDDYWKIIEWDNLLGRADANESNKFKRDKSIKFRQYCSSCIKEKGFSQRYPKSICRECYSKTTDLKGRKVEYFNSEAGGYGCQGYYVETEQKEKYDSDLCYIDRQEYLAEEARFGGIVIQLKK